MVMGELSQETELLVIGSGPGGYAAAFRAADLGLDVTMVDTALRPGAVCLYKGCIPSKTFPVSTPNSSMMPTGPNPWALPSANPKSIWKPCAAGREG